MDFKSPAHRECFELVQDYMTVLDWNFVLREDVNTPTLQLEFSDAPRMLIYVFVGDEPFVGFRLYLVTGADTRTDLYLSLLRKNQDIVIGKLCIDGDGDITLEHVLCGEDLDRGELNTAISFLALEGAEVVKDITAQYGGTAMP